MLSLSMGSSFRSFNAAESEALSAPEDPNPELEGNSLSVSMDTFIALLRESRWLMCGCLSRSIGNPFR